MTLTPPTFHANLKLLTGLIARKPQSYTADWAKSADEVFELYTNTSTINLIQVLNSQLIDRDWPFPAYIDISLERDRLIKELSSTTRKHASKIMSRLKWIWNMVKGPSVFREQFIMASDPIAAERVHSYLMRKRFKRNFKNISQYLHSLEILQKYHPILDDALMAYKRKMWACCISTTLPLIDVVARNYFGTDSLRISIADFVKAVRDSKLTFSDFMPGYAYNEAWAPRHKNNLIKSEEEDLRLIGIFLSSFIYFADKYYGWYDSSAAAPNSSLNRHAVLHCSCKYWSATNATKILVFLDLLLRLEKPIKILIHGHAAVTPSACP